MEASIGSMVVLDTGLIERYFSKFDGFYNSLKMVDSSFSKIFFIARKELSDNTTRYDKTLSENIKDSLKKIIIINMNRLFEMLSVHLFDKQINILCERHSVQICENTKSFLIEMMDFLIDYREKYCSTANTKNLDREIEQNSLEKVIIGIIIHEQTNKKRKKEEENPNFVNTVNTVNTHKRVVLTIKKPNNI
jgi:hypothetical protein